MATPESVVAGKSYLYAGSAILLGAGIAEVISGAVVIADSSGYYIGGVYVGIVAIITASRGFVLYQRSNLIAFAILLICTIIVSIVGTAIQASNYNFVSSLEACSSYSGTATTSCTSFPDTYTCTGNSDYFMYAYACEKTYTKDNGITDNQCSCVTNSDDGTCYSYTSIDDCHKLISVLPSALQTSYAFDLICLFTALILLAITIISFYKPRWIQSTSERRAAEEANPTLISPTVVTTSATSPIPATAYVEQQHGPGAQPTKQANYA